MKHLDTVLLVDDDAVDTFINKLVIKKLNLANKIEVAENGRKALDYIIASSSDSPKSSLPELIILDINMPVMGGFEFIQSLKKLEIEGKEQIELIIVSSSDDHRDVQMAKSYGLQIIEKPLNEEKLLRELNKKAA